jgi:LmbE family N-acetylglucosaminyl deacetylase
MSAPVVLSLMAHPDDAEFLCAGALARLADLGWAVHVASMTPGDCGSVELPPDEIARRRRAEGAAAAAVLGATFHCLERRDLLIFYDEPTLREAVRLLRRVRPRLLLTHSPADYLPDHEMTSLVARAAAFAAPVPNLFRGDISEPALDHVPHLYYADPIEGKDALGRPVEPQFRVDVSGVMDRKTAMLAAHASQREWLRRQHGLDQYVEAMRAWAARQGAAAGVAHAEGYRQHLGHSYPQDDRLGDTLGRV